MLRVWAFSRGTLCVFTFGIGGFFLEPYMQATYAEFYAAMRSKALKARYRRASAGRAFSPLNGAEAPL